MTEIEKIIRPIVEGQIRSFLHDHPEVLTGVTRHKPWGKTPAEWVKDSLAKRIVRDLTSGTTTARLEAAVLAFSSGAPLQLDAARATASAAPEVEASLPPGLDAEAVADAVMAQYPLIMARLAE